MSFSTDTLSSGLGHLQAGKGKGRGGRWTGHTTHGPWSGVSVGMAARKREAAPRHATS